jgi:hypothetical protein
LRSSSVRAIARSSSDAAAYLGRKVFRPTRRTDALTSNAPRLRRWLRGLVVAGAIFSVLGGLLLLFTPAIVSTGAFRRLVEREASAALRREVRIERLRWAWTEGLRLEGFSLRDEPTFSSTTPLVALDRLEVRVRLRDLLSRTLSFQLELQGLRSHVIRSVDGRTNWEIFLAALPPSEPEPPREGPLRVPLEISGRITLSDLRVEAEDRAQGRSASLSNGVLVLDVPSLRSKPLSLSLGVQTSADGRSLLPFQAAAHVDGLFDTEGVLRPTEGSGVLSASLPGVAFEASIGKGGGAARAELSVDLAELLTLAGPFLPRGAAPQRAAGSLHWATAASGDPREKLTFETGVTGTAIAASGPLLRGASVGPLSFSLSARGAVEAHSGSFEVESGEARLERSSAEWRARVSGVSTPHSRAAVHVGPVDLHLSELWSLARPFAGGVSFEPGAPSAARLSVQSASFEGPLSSETEPAQAEIVGLGLTAPSLRFREGETKLSAEGVDLEVVRLTATLVRAFPVRGALSARARVEKVLLGGGKQVSLRGFEAPALNLTAEGVYRDATAPFGVAARLSVANTLSLEELEIASLGTIAGLREELRASLSTRPKGGFEGEVSAARVSAAAVALYPPEGPSPSSAIRLQGSTGTPLRLEVQDARLSGLPGPGRSSLSAAALLLDLPSFEASL